MEDIFNLSAVLQAQNCSLHVVKHSQSDQLLSGTRQEDRTVRLYGFAKQPRPHVSRQTSGDIFVFFRFCDHLKEYVVFPS